MLRMLEVRSLLWSTRWPPACVLELAKHAVVAVVCARARVCAPNIDTACTGSPRAACLLAAGAMVGQATAQVASTVGE